VINLNRNINARFIFVDMDLAKKDSPAWMAHV